MNKDLAALGFIMVVALPIVILIIFMLAVKRKPFRALTPYMVAYAFALSALLGWFFGLKGWLLAVIVSFCIVGTWLGWRTTADAMDAVQALRERQGKSGRDRLGPE